MIKFSHYLEAVKEKQTGRVSQIFKNHLEKKFGTKIYVQKGLGEIKKSDGTIVFGTMFMLGDGKHAFRLNWVSEQQSANVDSIDFWLHPSANPQLTANTKDLSLVHVLKVIDDVISKGVKEVEFDDDDDEKKETSESLLLEETEEDEKKRKRKERRLKRLALQGALPEQINVREPDEWSELFDEPLNEKEIFSLMDDVIDKVKKGINKAVIISGDPGIGKCVHSDTDLEIQFF